VQGIVLFSFVWELHHSQRAAVYIRGCYSRWQAGDSQVIGRL